MIRPRLSVFTRSTFSVFLYSLFLCIGFVWAQSEPLNYNDALAQALESNADVLTAQVDLASAERDLARLEADPLALRIPLLQVQNAVENAQKTLQIAELSAQNAVATAYAEALEADTTLQLGEAQRAIAETQLSATQIRFEAGASTALDVDRAQNTLRNAERDVADAREAKALAYSRLASLLALSETPSLSDTVPNVAVPPLDEVYAQLESNAQLVAARQSVALSEAQVAAIDNAFSAKADIDAAKDDLDNARTRLRETERSLRLSLRQSYNGVVAAQSRVQRAEADLKTSQENLDAQQVRYDAGSISLLELENSRVEVLSAQASLQTARHSLANGLRQLTLSTEGGGL